MLVRRLLLGMLALVLVTGCSSSDATNASTITGYAGPAEPVAASADTRAGALAYAEHYVATYNYARRTGDLNGLPPLEAAECQTCQALRHGLADVYDNGGSIDGGSWTLTSPTIKAAEGGWVVTSPVRVSPSTVVTPSAGPEKVGASSSRITLEITQVVGRWKVLVCDKEV